MPATKPRVSVVFTEAQYAVLQAHADAEGITISEVVRRAVEASPYFVQQGLDWPSADIQYGGVRPRAGRKPQETGNDEA